MTIDYRTDLNRRLKDPQFKKEYDDLEMEFIIIRAVIEARKRFNLTQKELSNRTGINQADISRLERGLSNPTIKLLRKLAEGLDMNLELRFVPKTK
jgi:predicted transcriptional regulator